MASSPSATSPPPLMAQSTRLLTTSDQKQLRQILSKTHAFVRTYMSRYDASHDFAHVLRVLNLSLTLADKEEKLQFANAPPGSPQRPLYDRAILSLAALLHDVGDKKYIGSQTPGGSSSSSNVTPGVAPISTPLAPPATGSAVGEGGILTAEGGVGNPVSHFLHTQAGASKVLSDAVQKIVSHISYSHEVANGDAVRAVLRELPELAVVQDADRLDAIGAVGIGRTFTYSGAKGTSGKGMERVLTHFEEKLLGLERRLKTEAGREEGKERTKRLKEFEKWWREEKRLAGDVGMELYEEMDDE